MNKLQDIDRLNFSKLNGLLPVIVQDRNTQKVLMLGFMNKEALEKTMVSGKVTFFSQSKNHLWIQGEDSGNFIKVTEILVSCNQDSLLIKADPAGPACDTGTDTCFGEINSEADLSFLSYLQDVIDKRKKEMPQGSYTTSLLSKGSSKIAQKVGEEAIETIIGALTGDDENFIYESADLMYHLLVLLSYKGYRIEDVVDELRNRHK